MKILIIGAGLAGSLAYKALASYRPQLYEAKEYSEDISEHSAVLRIRNLDVAKYLGCPYQEIWVEKVISFDGRIYNRCTPQLNNLYSRKLYNVIAERSIMNLGRQKRYLLDFKSIKDENTHYGHSLVSIRGGYSGGGTSDESYTFKLASFTREDDLDMDVEYDICISTIPMFVMSKVAGSPFDTMTFGGSPISVVRLKIKVDSTVHQTVYYPDFRRNAYRATLENQTLIIEALDTPDDAEISQILEDFGLTDDLVDSKPRHSIQPFGKMSSIDDDVRKSLILWLTESCAVYSFGRFAVWKSLRADHLVDDIDKIKRMIDVGEVSRKYYTKLGG